MQCGAKQMPQPLSKGDGRVKASLQVGRVRESREIENLCAGVIRVHALPMAKPSARHGQVPLTVYCGASSTAPPLLPWLFGTFTFPVAVATLPFESVTRK